MGTNLSLGNSQRRENESCVHRNFPILGEYAIKMEDTLLVHLLSVPSIALWPAT